MRPGPAREVASGPIGGVAERTQVVDCPVGHRLPPSTLRDAALTAAAETLLVARRHLTRQRCGSCDERLMMPLRRTRRAVTVATDELPVATLDLELPLTRCPGCGADNLPAGARRHLRSVVGWLTA